MEYHRQTIGSSALADIIDLPPSLKDKKVEIIIFPVENETKKQVISLILVFLKGHHCQIVFLTHCPRRIYKHGGYKLPA